MLYEISMIRGYQLYTIDNKLYSISLIMQFIPTENNENVKAHYILRYLEIDPSCIKYNYQEFV